MRCIIIDENTLSTDHLRSFVERVPFLQLIKTFTNPFEGMHFIQENKVDLAFIDAEMSQLNGFELLKSLSVRIQVIFTATNPDGAILGYELEAVDFLVKPIPFERFLKSVNKACRFQPSFQNQVLQNEPFHNCNNYEFILVKTGYHTIRINFEDILYFEGVKDYVKIHLQGKFILTLNSLKKFEEALPKERFVRVHKSFIVQLSKIDAIQNNRINICKSLIPIGDTYKTFFTMKTASMNV